MTITTDQAIALAREVGAKMTRPLAPHEFSVHAYTFSEQELTALCNAVRKQTLLEAAEFHEKQYGHSWELRRMAGGM